MPSGFRVLPGTVTIETDQRIRFRGEMRTVRGHVSSPQLSWEASGGRIDSVGNFSATIPGTYRVVGRRSGHGRDLRHRPDTSVVVVVRRVPGVIGVQVSPRKATVEAGETRAFTALGRLPGGKQATIGVTWAATGGTIDPAGVYRAGNTPGVYQVIAKNLRGNLADTVPVKVTAPTLPDTIVNQPDPTPAPEPTPDPTPEPVAPLARVVLRPASLILATRASHQFTAWGKNTSGDSVAIDVVFSATGGSINQQGLYTAGQTAGSYKVIAVSGSLVDTTVVTLLPTAGGGEPTPIPGTGIPFGSSGAFDLSSSGAPFTMALKGVTPGSILSDLRDARAARARLVINMTGGKHENYMTGGVFDRAKWEARMNAYNTPEIRQAVAQAVADGTIVGNSVMDEPNVHGSGDGNTWGPPGTMTKARVDSLCGYAKSIFPTLPVGVAHRHDVFEPSKSYRVCEFVISQYSNRVGSVTAFRDAGLAMARRDGHAIMFGINILNGGIQDRDGTWDCPGGVKGTYAPNCAMTATQVRDYGLALGPAGCGLIMWRYDAQYMANPDNKRAFYDVAARLSSLPAKACRRN